MNKKAQSTGLTIIGVIVFVIAGFTMINFLFDEVDTFRLDLDCASPDSISSATKLVCLVGDLSIPLWIFAIISLVVILIIGSVFS